MAPRRSRRGDRSPDQTVTGRATRYGRVAYGGCSILGLAPGDGRVHSAPWTSELRARPIDGGATRARAAVLLSRTSASVRVTPETRRSGASFPTRARSSAGERSPHARVAGSKPAAPTVLVPFTSARCGFGNVIGTTVPREANVRYQQGGAARRLARRGGSRGRSQQGLRGRRCRRPSARRRIGGLRTCALYRDHGPVGVGEVHAAPLHGRPRHADLRPGVHRGRRPHDAVGEGSLLRRRSVGFIFQAYNLVPTLTAAENITLPLDIAGEEPDGSWFDVVVDAVRIRDRLSHRPAELSGGQQQRGSPGRGRSSPAPRSSSRTSRRATWTRGRATRSSSSSAAP